MKILGLLWLLSLWLLSLWLLSLLLLLSLLWSQLQGRHASVSAIALPVLHGG
ncbi:MAG: hypothetical protein ACKOCM_12075 [Cyanobacteriota bacterium]